MQIYKILRGPEWLALQAQGQTDGSVADLADGFIHLSTAEQVQGTVSKHFAAEQGLMLLECDTAALADDLRWEPARNGALFPHLYRPLRLVDVRSVSPVAQDTDTTRKIGEM